MKLGRILTLLVLVAALGAWLYWVELPKAKQEEEGQKLVAAETDAVTGVDLVFADREIRLRKDGSTWKLVAPVEDEADEPAVKALLGALTGARVAKTIDEAKDLAAFGLDKPDPTVRLAVAGNPGPTIHVGKNTQIGGKTYVRIGDEPAVRLTASSLKLALNKQAKDLRDKQLLTFQDEQVQTVDIAQDGRTATLVRKDKDAWTVEPGGHVADPTEVRSYLASLRSTRAVEFPTVDAAAAGLEQPRLAITVTLDQGAAQTLQIGGETTAGTSKQIYARRADQPTIVALGEWSWRTLAKDVNQFRDKTVMGFDPDRAGRVVVERKSGTGATLVRSGGGWTVEGVTDKPVREGVITRMLDDLRDLKGASVVAEPATDLKPWGLDAPELHITVVDKDGQPLGTVLATRKDDKHYAMREGAQTAYEVRDYMYTRLDKQQSDFVGPEPAPATPPADDDGGLELDAEEE